ncbi:hypothetical protein [Streptomyces sp. NPDC018000]|uniref:hypothetical protein n=1 Tax=Streptomyces sp. NPDC018000 TaxID=3365028 RepID=UPI0037892A08
MGIPGYGVDAAVAPDAQEDLRFDGLGRAAHGGVRLLPAGDGVGLVGPQHVESRGGGIPVGWDMAEGERAADVGVGAGRRRARRGPVQGARDVVGGEGAVSTGERGDQGEGVAGGSGWAPVEDFAVAGPLEGGPQSGC